MQIICLGSSAWGRVTGRARNILSRLPGVEVLYFEPSPSRLARGKRKGYWRRPGQKVRANVTVYTLPPVLPVRQEHPRLESMNLKRVARFVGTQMDRHGFVEPLLWLCSPVNARLVKDIPHQGLVYDCHREWTELSILRESELAYEADLIFAASPGLVRHVSPCNTNVALLPNGANATVFSRATMELEKPAELQKLRRPILGYLGNISAGLDLEPLLFTARNHPQWSFVLLGRVDRKNPSVPALQKLRNIYFLPYRTSVNLPEYLAQFDVGLDFLHSRDRGEDVIPSRVYEYLLAGKPVVTTFPPGYIPQYPDLVYTAANKYEFESGCHRALAENDSRLRLRREAAGREADWAARAELAAQVLEANGML